MLGYQREEEVEILCEFSLNLVSNSVFAFVWKFLSTHKFEQEIWHAKKRRQTWKRRPGVCLSLTNKPVWKQLMYHNFASLYLFHEGRKQAKKTDIELFPMNYRKWSHHSSDYFLVFNRQVSFRLRLLRRRKFGSVKCWLE